VKTKTLCVLLSWLAGWKSWPGKAAKSNHDKNPQRIRLVVTSVIFGLPPGGFSLPHLYYITISWQGVNLPQNKTGQAIAQPVTLKTAHPVPAQGVAAGVRAAQL
jgi:hypothetical protein